MSKMDNNNLIPYQVLIILLNFSTIVSSILLKATRQNTMDDQYHLEGAIDQFTSKSVIRCLSDCSSRLQCMSFFYNKDTMDCILHSDSFIYTVPTEQGDGWRFYLTEDVSGRCPSSNEFKYYRALDLCYSIHAPVQIDFTAIKTFCAGIGGELIRISSEQIQQYIQKVTVQGQIWRAKSGEENSYNKPYTCFLQSGYKRMKCWNHECHWKRRACFGKKVSTAADPTERICIQGTDTINPTNWTFDDGTPMTYFNWDTDADEPSGNRGRLEIFTNYKWHDLPSTSSNQCLRICERMRII